MGARTPLFEAQQRAGARMVAFAGWDMPVHYGSQMQEHRAVRAAAGMFDVSHMAVVDIRGGDARAFLRLVLANDVAKADSPGTALYGCMLNDQAGVVDDLIVYHLQDGFYRAVLNAATTHKDLAWMRAHAQGLDVEIAHRDDLSIIAVQGPQARERTRGLLPEGLAARAMECKPFRAVHAADWLVGRTGYTGEDGFECILPTGEAPAMWRALADSEVAPCGLGARDTLRLEAGLMLYGQDLDEQHHPLESGVGWTVAWKPEDRDFVGRRALSAARQNQRCALIGLLLEDKGVMRAGQVVRHSQAAGQGVLTSAGYGPTVERSLGLARVPLHWNDAPGLLEVEIRGRPCSARRVGFPFVRHGKVVMKT
ncbi:MAG: glycine cleavage system aminomethyltransferase GcvT [Salinisphaera sp.]|nr:glycine cleavage system aminomethyltransferase GcvT [Salinisphaera sp.]